MKKLFFISLMFLFSITPVFCEDNSNFDVIEFQREEEHDTLLNPSSEIFQIRVEKNVPLVNK